MGFSADAASLRYRAAEYFCSFKMLQLLENVGRLPAACQVEPEVNSSRSKSRASFTPKAAKW